MSEYDLIIVGGGLAGASLASALARQNRRIAVVESHPLNSDEQPSFDERTIALTYSSRMVYEGLGVWEEMLPDACPIHDIHISDRGHFGVTRLGRKLVGTDALGYVIPTRSVGRALHDATRNIAHLVWHCPASVIELNTAPDQVEVLLSTSDKLSAPLVVIADGGRSSLSRQAGLKLDARPYEQKALVTIVAVSQNHNHLAYERFTRHGPLALLPMNYQDEWRYAVAWTLPSDEAESMSHVSDEAFLEALQLAFGDRAGRFTRCGARKCYPLSLGIMTDPAKNRAIAIGNAAHIVHPVAGQGFNLGLKDVAWLAELIARAWASNQDIGCAGFLQTYNQARNRQSQRVGMFTNGMISLFSDDFPGISLTRNTALNALDLIPPVKRLLLQRTMGMSGKQPRLVRGLSIMAEKS